MFNAVKRFWKRRVPVTLKRPSRPGLSYSETIELLRGLKHSAVRDGKYRVLIDAYDLMLLLDAHAEASCQVKTDEGYSVRPVAMWGEDRELGLQEWIEVAPIPGYNYAAIYKYDRCIRTGQ